MKKVFITLISLFLCVFFSLSALAYIDASNGRFYDGADIIDDIEENAIKTRLDQLSEKYKVDFVFASVPDVEGYTATTYAENYYLNGMFGTGEYQGGVLLFITLNDEDGDRAYRIHVNGFALEAITAEEQDSIGQLTVSYLSGSDYVSAIEVFLEECEYQINGEINGFPFDFSSSILISVIIGLIIALIVTGIWRMQLKSVRKQSAANLYTKSGSMKVTAARDFFLYRTISRVRIQNNSTSSGSRSSGGGRTSGGKF